MISSVQRLIPKNPDQILRVIVIGRISTEHQDEGNIEASQEFAIAHLRRLYDGPTELFEFGEQASGMLAGKSH
jgi:hypothetical protein